MRRTFCDRCDVRIDTATPRVAIIIAEDKSEYEWCQRCVTALRDFAKPVPQVMDGRR